MTKQLSWFHKNETLFLFGELERNLLIPLWNARQEIIKDVVHINLDGISRIDTAGIALLVHLIALAKNNNINITISYTNRNILSLAQLYNLPSDVLPL